VKCPLKQRVEMLDDVEAIEQQFPAAEIERVMKIQEEFLRLHRRVQQQIHSAGRANRDSV
jgi:hypothetical protein